MRTFEKGEPRSIAELDKGRSEEKCPNCKTEDLVLIDDYSDWLYACDKCNKYFSASELKLTS